MDGKYKGVCVIKGNFCMIGDDLVNSYHLLLCCLDLVFGNALLCSNRKELINPSFKGGSTPNSDILGMIQLIFRSLRCRMFARFWFWT